MPPSHVPPSDHTPSPRLLTVQEVAQRCALSPRSIWVAIADGKLAVVRFGARATRVEPTELERFIAAARDRSARR